MSEFRTIRARTSGTVRHSTRQGTASGIKPDAIASSGWNLFSFFFVFFIDILTSHGLGYSISTRRKTPRELAMSGWWSMENELECGNCGRIGNRYTIVEATRRCGTGLGEWYCMEGEGCQAEKQEDTEEGQ